MSVHFGTQLQVPAQMLIKPVNMDTIEIQERINVCLVQLLGTRRDRQVFHKCAIAGETLPGMLKDSLVNVHIGTR